MPSSIWRGAVSFGLVNVPVRLVTATSPKSVRFNQLHATDLARINQKRVCSKDGEEVDYTDIVKGYDLGGGNYVVVENEELDALDPEASHTVDIEEFVDLDEIDPIFYEHTYYLVPEERAAKPYALLVQAMQKAKKVALGRFVLRTKQYWVTVRAHDGVLVLATMLYEDEVVNPATLDLPDVASTAPSDKELDMASALVESLSNPFDPAQYKDEYREKLLALIEAKSQGQVFEAPEPEEPSAPVVDLMAALEASLAAARERKEGGQGQVASEPARSA